MTTRLVNAETLAAALHDRYQSQYGGCDHWEDGVMAGSTPDCEEDAAAILAAIPPDPRLISNTWDKLVPWHASDDCPECGGSKVYGLPYGCQDDCEDEANCECDCHDQQVSNGPPDPRLDALLAAAREAVDGDSSIFTAHTALRDALAAFEEPV